MTSSHLMSNEPSLSSGSGSYVGKILLELFDEDRWTIGWTGPGFTQLRPGGSSSGAAIIAAQKPLALAMAQAALLAVSGATPNIGALPDAFVQPDPITQNSKTMGMQGMTAFRGRVLIEGWLDGDGTLRAHIASDPRDGDSGTLARNAVNWLIGWSSDAGSGPRRERRRLE